MKSSIYIKELALEAFVGAYEHEKISKQPILLDLYLSVDSSHGIATDHLKDVVDYSKVAELCHRVVEEHHYHLIETLAATLIQEIKSAFRIQGIKIIVKKPRALSRADFVAVIMEE